MSEWNDRAIIPKGALIAVTEGEYSDYQCMTLVVALADLNIKSLKDRYLSTYPKQTEEYRFQEYQFIAWLVLEGLVEEQDYTEWHLGSYGMGNFRAGPSRRRKIKSDAS